MSILMFYVSQHFRGGSGRGGSSRGGSSRGGGSRGRVSIVWYPTAASCIISCIIHAPTFELHDPGRLYAAQQ